MPDSRPTKFTAYIDWDNDGEFTSPIDDVTPYFLRRSDFSSRRGRDQSRSLAPMAPSDASLDLNNASRRFSPDNVLSPLSGLLVAGKAVQVSAEFNGDEYCLFSGNVDDYKLNTSTNSRTVNFTLQDVLGQLAEHELSTQLFETIRTGDAIHHILDEVGWAVDKRDIDPGVTHLKFWYVEGETAFDALKVIQDCEGPPAVMYQRGDGTFVFRDRHHRITRTTSLTSQADIGYGNPLDMKLNSFSYESGWRNVINKVTIDVPQRWPDAYLSEVWATEDIITLSAGETQIIKITSSDPFIHGQIPDPELGDYQLNYGAVSFVLSRESGASTELRISASVGSQIAYLKFRARKITGSATVAVIQEDTGSISAHGAVKTYRPELPFVTIWDALAHAQLVLAQRAFRKPIVSFVVQAKDAVHTTQVLTREISDRIRVAEAESCLDADVWIEQIEHVVTGGGTLLETKYGCEVTADIAENVFRFNDADNGFDEGVFGQLGMNDPDTVFRFDTAGRGFDDGTFAV